MTSRGCTKSYNRKVNSNAASIQFDKLFRENTNRPSAAKSAGTVGKWGITSFTSIRSTNINGRKSTDAKTNHGIKRAKLDYGNQNVHEKETFTYNKPEEVKPDVKKPKKFFKSRNANPGNEKSSEKVVPSISPVRDLDIDQQSSKDSLFGRKEADSNFDSVTDTSFREEGKPPIVLRICKGTARLLSSEDTDSESYRISTPPPIQKINIDRKAPIQDTKMNVPATQVCQESSSSTSGSTSQEKSSTRTTRSKAKTSKIDSTSTTSIPLVSSQGTGLSLTLRKSTNDSTSTSVSHYDIVKTESTLNTNTDVDKISKSTPILPTTTQDLIDILSNNDSELVQSKSASINCHTATKVKELDCNEEVMDSINLDLEDTDKGLQAEDNPNTANVYPETRQIIKHTSPCKSEPDLLNIKDTKDATSKTLDQDWFSSSDDSECAGSSLQNEFQIDSHLLTDSKMELEPSAASKIINKPTSNKKGSIFKTRTAGTTNGNKRRALYKHKWCDNDKELKSNNANANNTNAPGTSSARSDDSNIMAFDEEFEDTPLTRIVIYPESETNLENNSENIVTSIRCDKKVKGFYTVVKNVKKAHQIQESGEFQEFNDDVEYILDTLRENNPNATRCLSAIRLASKCMAPAFRMHVRAHGTVAKFFKALHDATTDQSLALCTATVMFVLSQDRLAMDLDRDCLELMLSLLESDASHKNALNDCGLSHAELQKNKEKVRQLCADIQAQGHAKHLNLDNITVGQLAMETLLSLTSKRAGEWFKEELRELGGLEHIVKTITDCHRQINSSNVSYYDWDEPLLDKLRKVDRCLRVLENVTHMNEENQVYLLKYNDSILVITLASLYSMCGNEILKCPVYDSSDKSSTGAVISECLLAIIKVLINMTHRFNKQSIGGKTVGSQNEVIDNSLHVILHVPQSLPEEKRFDIVMLALILLINMTEECEDNKKLLVFSDRFSDSKEKENGLDALISLFYKQEELARAEEQKTDAILDGKKDSEQSEVVSTTSKSQEEFIEETVAKLLQKAGRHMEHTLIGAYVVLLLGYLIMDNKVYENLVRSKLPNQKFETMVTVLQKFFNFMNLTASNETSNCGIAATDKVIKFLKTSDERLLEENQDVKSFEEKNIIDHSTS